MGETRPGRAGTRAFRSAAEWRAWLERNHTSATALVVRCRKAHVRGPGLTYPEALDEALCFGWIDGVRRRVDDDSFSIRFSPRRPGSIWSAVNIRRVGELEAGDRMRPAGRGAFAARTERRSRVYSYENRGTTELDPAYRRRLQADPEAWAYFQARPPGYRRTSIFWVMEAKREETRLRRLDILLRCSAAGKPIPLLTREPTRARRKP
ncbi:MAG TPA: YdeI/OmpD-associated family protein [Gemmatimonadales bacterium]|nr:YdeI/OmpD-associated family protein [Gemmatimonadales bacterium]